jgi:guanylate kinase
VNALSKKGRLVVVTGPSGVGKTSLIKKLLEEYKDRIKFSVSYTSRFARSDEYEGVDYFFISRESFEADIKENMFLEYAVVHDNYYGTGKKFVENIIDSGVDCLLDVDVQGGLALMEKNLGALFIFIAPPTIDDLRQRLIARSTDAPEVIEKRVKNAEKELAYKDKYDYIVINNDFEQAYKELTGIIFGK